MESKDNNFQMVNGGINFLFNRVFGVVFFLHFKSVRAIWFLKRHEYTYKK